MKIANSNRIVWSSSIAAVMVASMMLAKTAEPPSSGPEFIADPINLSYLLTKTDDRFPGWLRLPPESNSVAFRHHGTNGQRGRVTFFNAAEADKIKEFYTRDFIEAGGRISYIVARNKSLKVSSVRLASGQASGLEIEVTIRDIGNVRGVEIMYRQSRQDIAVLVD